MIAKDLVGKKIKIEDAEVNRKKSMVIGSVIEIGNIIEIYELAARYEPIAINDCLYSVIYANNQLNLTKLPYANRNHPVTVLKYSIL